MIDSTYQMLTRMQRSQPYVKLRDLFVYMMIVLIMCSPQAFIDYNIYFIIIS